jgi:hypothetical protein
MRAKLRDLGQPSNPESPLHYLATIRVPPAYTALRARLAPPDGSGVGAGAERTVDACVSSRIAFGSPSQPPPESTPESAQAYLFLSLFHPCIRGGVYTAVP